jgi:xeroderma pigmentosum group C-complementing protein
MPPKRRGRSSKNTQDNDESHKALTGLASTSESSATPRRKTNTDRKGKVKATQKRNDVPDVYREMLAEALPSLNDSPERPLKRQRTGKRDTQVTRSDPVTQDIDENEDEDLEFENVLRSPEERESSDEDEFKLLPKLQQTAYRDSDESDQEDEDFDWEGIDLGVKTGDGEASKDLELTLTRRPEPKVAAPRRKVVSKDEKVVRLMIHKMHGLGLLSVLDKRNIWVNDPTTQEMLKGLLDKKTLSFLRPRTDLSQFSQTDSLKRGLEQACVIWRTKFQVTERGMRRALWAEDEKDITNVSNLI